MENDHSADVLVTVNLVKLPVQTVAIFGYLEPLFAVVFAAILLGEKMTALQVLGACCIIGGAMVGELVRGKRQRI